MAVHTFKVRRVISGVASGCHGAPTVEVLKPDGTPAYWVTLPLDSLTGEIVPDGATVRITVEIIDPAERTVPTNFWHARNRRDCRCVTVDDPGCQVPIHGLGLKAPEL